jgi:hypothetical protein
MLAPVRPRDAGKTRRRIAAEAKMKKATAERNTIVDSRGPHLTDIHGV